MCHGRDKGDVGKMQDADFGGKGSGSMLVEAKDFVRKVALLARAIICQKDSCNLMWTAVRPRSTELKLQNMELKQEHFRKSRHKQASAGR